MAEKNEIQYSFSREMRKATRDVHKLSDSLVNAKLAFALSYDAVWAEGLLVFYEIFKFLEEHVAADILPPEFCRLEAFEEDLSYYLGNNWKESYKVRPEVSKYLLHLTEIHRTEPIRLMVYVYHLYMGLLSGGQILQKKRSLAKRLLRTANDNDVRPGEQLTYFQDYSVAALKNKMRTIIDNKAIDLNEETKQALLDESRRVFQLNNEIIRTIKGVNEASFQKIIILIMIIIMLWYLYRLIFH